MPLKLDGRSHPRNDPRAPRGPDRYAPGSYRNEGRRTLFTHRGAAHTRGRLPVINLRPRDGIEPMKPRLLLGTDSLHAAIARSRHRLFACCGVDERRRRRRIISAGAAVIAVSTTTVGSAVAKAVPTLPHPHLTVASARSVCFAYSANAKGYQGRDGGYRKLVVAFSGTGLEPGDHYTLVPLMLYHSRWTQIGAGISFGFRASTRSYESRDAQVTSAYATDALIIPHAEFAARFTLTNFGTSRDIALMNAGKLRPGVSNDVAVTVPASSAASCPRRLP